MLDDVRALRVAWDRHPAGMLDNYLIRQVENPCINAQSVLLRALLLDALFPTRFTELINREMRYAACALTCLHAIDEGWDPRAAISTGTTPHSADTRAGTIGLLRDCVQQGIDVVDLHDRLVRAEATGWQAFTSPFECHWRSAVTGLSAHARVLELACGSANDARYHARYGLGRFLEYTGVDLCRKNLANAARHVPDGRFLCADARALPFPDRSHDYVFACDLLEHLPEWGIEEVLCEAARVARREIWLSLFDADWIPAHEIRTAELYHLNTLSLSGLRTSLRAHGFASYVVDIPREWAQAFPGYRHYNDHARLIVAARSGQ